MCHVPPFSVQNFLLPFLLKGIKSLNSVGTRRSKVYRHGEATNLHIEMKVQYVEALSEETSTAEICRKD